jgi:hypothetical protein
MDATGPGGADLILAGGIADNNTSPVDDGHPKSYTTTGVVNLTASKEEIAANAHLDYVTNGVVILGDLEEPTITSPLWVKEKELKKTIRAACGDKIKDLALALDSEQTLRIRLQVGGKDEQELRQTILALPALADYNVNLSIQVSP